MFVRVTIVVTVTASGTLTNTATVTSTVLDPNTQNAAIRHQLAGRSNACEILPPEIRARLI